MVMKLNPEHQEELQRLGVADLPWRTDGIVCWVDVADGEWIEINFKARQAWHRTQHGADFYWGDKDCRPGGSWEDYVRNEATHLRRIIQDQQKRLKS